MKRVGIPIKPQDLSENEDQNHADEDAALLHVRADARVTNNANAVTCREPSKPNGKPTPKVQESPAIISMALRGRLFNGLDEREEVVALLRGRSEILGDEDGDDEGVNCENTGHNHRNQALRYLLESIDDTRGPSLYLHDQVWPEGSDTSDADS